MNPVRNPEARDAISDGVKRWMAGGVLFIAVAGVIYLATLGCYSMLKNRSHSVDLARMLGLNAEQKEEFGEMEDAFLAQKNEACRRLCQKRALLIAALKEEKPDPALLNNLAEEIGRDQTALEKATLEHLLSVSPMLSASQRKKLFAFMTDQLRDACKMTACGASGGCYVSKEHRQNDGRAS